MTNVPRKSVDAELRIIGELEKKVLWLSSWTIHHANHIRESTDGLKVGGHQASSASLAAIMTALYFHTLRPQDRVAVKPHASPNFHAIQYLLGKQTREKLKGFRGYKGAQSYPSRTKDTDDVDFSTGSVGLGVAQTLFSSLVQDYVRAHFKSDRPEGRFVALVGDAEMDEGNIFEAIHEGWKQGLRNCWWVIDYNRQSLDAVIREGLWARYEALFKAFGWDVVIVKHGELQEAAFKEPGGEALRSWINNCPNQLYSALTFQGGAAWRKRLMNDLGDQGPVSRLIDKRSDEELARLMGNLGGHDLPSLIEAFDAAAKHDRPTCFICYTIKGSGLALAGHKDNHAGMMTPAQMEALRTSMGIRVGHEWDRFEGLSTPENELQAFLDRVPFATEETRRYRAPRVEVPAELTVAIQPTMSTQFGFGALLNELGRGDSDFVKRIVTTSPDVTVSTNLGPWVNRRNLFAREKMADTFKSERIASTFNWEFAPTGQHIELGIAENNLFIALSALGLSHSISGERLFPIGTLYDPFIARGLDALNYACYQDARFLLVATPSGITLGPEGGAHQSINPPLIALGQPGLRHYEPAFADELALMMEEAFRLIDDPAGESTYLRLSTRSIRQVERSDERWRDGALQGAYWLRDPGLEAEAAIVAMGAVMPEALAAWDELSADIPGLGLLAVTSPDLLHRGWTAAQASRWQGKRDLSQAERLLSLLSPSAGLVTIADAAPASLSWLGGVIGQRVAPLGVERFGQTGSLADLYAAYRLDGDAITQGVAELLLAQ